jgi:DNA-binding response OmpR family regulator
MSATTELPIILLVEDSAEVRILARGLLYDWARVQVAESAAEAKAILSLQRFDLILVDVGLPDPDEDGFDVLAWARNSPLNADVEVFFLTGRRELSDRLRALRCGADDYITKPFAAEEFVERVRGGLRRRRGSAQTSSSDLKANYSHLSIDYRLLRVTDRSGRDLGLTPNEFRLISYLLEQPGVFRSRDTILKDLWGELGVKVTERTVDTHVCSLRKKLGDLGSQLESLPSQGYRINP